MIIEINNEHPQPRKIDKIADRLHAGELIIYPTDTVYGVGCDIFNSDAVKRLHQLVKNVKEEPSHSPLSFICDDLSEISDYAYVKDPAYRMLKRMLPGPYTFIFEATKLVPTVMQNERDTLGIRVPDHPVPRLIVQALGHPIATTSVTHPDGELLPDPWTIDEYYGHSVDAIIDGGYVFPEPSTVIDFSDDYPKLVREGKGPIGDLDYVEFV